MHILFLTRNYRPTPCGVGDYTFGLANALASRGIQISILTSETPARAGPEQTEAGIMIYRTVANWTAAAFPPIISRVRALKADVVSFQWVPHLYGRGGLTIASLLPLSLRTRTTARQVCTLHEIASPVRLTPRRVARSLLHYGQLLLIAAGTERFVVTNPWYESLMRKFLWGNPRISLIPVGSSLSICPQSAANRAETRKELGLGEGLLLGDFSPSNPDKRLNDLVRLASRLGEQAAILFIGGLDTDHKRRSEVESYARALGVSNRIHWTGYVSAARASHYLSSLDLYVHTHTAGASTRSTSLVAALAAGLPTIAYRGRETSDLFQDRRNIMLVTPGDADELVTAARQLLECQELRHSISEGAANLYRRHFTWEAIAAQFLEAVA